MWLRRTDSDLKIWANSFTLMSPSFCIFNVWEVRMPKRPWRTMPLITTLWRSTYFCRVYVRVCSYFETLELNSNPEYLSSHEAEGLANLYNGWTEGEFLDMAISRLFFPGKGCKVLILVKVHELIVIAKVSGFLTDRKEWILFSPCIYCSY